MNLVAPLPKPVVFAIAAVFSVVGIVLFALAYGSAIGAEWFPVATTIVIFAAMAVGRVGKPQVLVANLLSYVTVGAGVVGGYLTELTTGGFAVVAVAAAGFAFLEARDDSFWGAQVSHSRAKLIVVLVAVAVGVLLAVAGLSLLILQEVASRV
ncbi:MULTISPECIES: hypothetical protein [unclassified Rathayibacter]|uniref:hypothetical protein n=1 Tax=unclassified Rathayibacter TaxID=2609250 RepID=UPI000CE7B9A5|nr:MULTISPECIES: hypothetical protein [unclassified Rathayibacter]PPH53172.1 hypothetical protein C5C49_06225 [Rathayibacter sp. AY1E2]PPI40753.1 hypothetical protein C5D50_04255 [Rathayibacter sp. RFBD1]PPI60754.1 hypothetical protein C5D38_03990 [Rathayibacter sp. TRS19]